MKCPICGSRVLYQGMNTIECEGSHILLDDSTEEGIWGACTNYKKQESAPATDGNWIEKFKDELRGLSWLQEARICARPSLRGFCIDDYWPSFETPKAVFSPVSTTIYVLHIDFRVGLEALHAVLGYQHLASSLLKSHFLPPLGAVSPLQVPTPIEFPYIPLGLAFMWSWEQKHNEAVSGLNSLMRGSSSSKDS